VGTSRNPQLVVLSEIDLTGPTGVVGGPIAAAVRFVLAEHRFRAGRFTLGYQSCDVGVPTGAVGLDKCQADARTYALTPRVVGVVGTFHSFCTFGELQFLSPAPGGPVALISPANMDPSLTAADTVTYRGGPHDFARVVATGTAVSDATLVLAHRLNVRRLLLVARYPSDAADLEQRLEAASVRGRPEIVGSAAWGTTPRAHRELVRALGRLRPDGVVLDGPLDAAEGGLLRTLRQRLGPHVPLIGTDNALPIPDLLGFAGRAAVGLYVVTEQVPYEALTPAGKRWALSFAAQTPDQRVSIWAPMAAQATEVLLDAIAHSDGTRASIVKAMFATHVNDGILGSFHFVNGEITPARVTVLRVVGGQSRQSVQPDYQGAVVDRVIPIG
jgi:hypothetical protein